jgi:molybdopterin/thiamine biosynthesis adenylyltransferase
VTSAGLSSKTALLVGMGGLGCPAALCLAQAGVGRLILLDDDLVSEDNLHRQILYRDADVGRPKLDAARDALSRFGCEIVTKAERLVPETALGLLHGADVVVEGADNFATKFLAADAARVAVVPIVHGAGVRWHGTALLTAPQGRPCYRCLFEDLLPDELAPNCAGAGVIGPNVGVIGALMADLALDAVQADFSRAGTIFSFDAKRLKLRGTRVACRPGCATCGAHPVQAEDLARNRYVAPATEPLFEEFLTFSQSSHSTH